jgi:hypothetical protein
MDTKPTPTPTINNNNNLTLTLTAAKCPCNMKTGLLEAEGFQMQTSLSLPPDAK